MEVASKEFTVGSGLIFRVAAVATKKIAAAKEQRGKMGAGLQGPRSEAGEKCQEEAWHWEGGAGGQEFGTGRENRE